jgi:hypothetical protein
MASPLSRLTKSTLAKLAWELAQRQGDPIAVIAATEAAREASPRDRQSIAGLINQKCKILPVRILGRCS